MKRKLICITMVFVLALACMFTGCSSTSGTTTPNEDPSNEGTVENYYIGMGGDWGYPSPYTMIRRGPGYSHMYLVNDCLIWKDSDGNFIPGLAKEWQYDEAAATYTFTLQDHIKWHDGEDFSVEDILFTYEYYKEFPLTWINLDSIKEVNKINDKTVEFVLAKSFAPFLSNLAGSMPILPKHIYADVKDPFTEKSMDLCVGCGPYKLVEYTPEQGNYAYEAFADYYQGEARVKNIKFVATSKEMAPDALIQGKLDLIMPSGDALAKIEAADFETKDTLGMYAKLKFNLQLAPFNQKEFRQAIAYAIDAQEVIAIAQRGFPFEGQTGAIAASNKYFYGDVEHYDINTAKTDALMEGLGYAKEGDFYAKNGEVLELTLLAHDRVERDAEVIAKQLNAAGIKTEIILKDLTTADEKLRNGDFEFSIVEGGTSGDPISLNQHIVFPGASSDLCTNPEIKQLLLDQIGALNEEERTEILKEFQIEYSEELPGYMLYYSRFYAAYSDKVDVNFVEGGFGIGIPLAYNQINFQ